MSGLLSFSGPIAGQGVRVSDRLTRQPPAADRAARRRPTPLAGMSRSPPRRCVLPVCRHGGPRRCNRWPETARLEPVLDVVRAEPNRPVIAAEPNARDASRLRGVVEPRPRDAEHLTTSHGLSSMTSVRYVSSMASKPPNAALGPSDGSSCARREAPDVRLERMRLVRDDAKSLECFDRGLASTASAGNLRAHEVTEPDARRSRSTECAELGPGFVVDRYACDASAGRRPRRRLRARTDVISRWSRLRRATLAAAWVPLIVRRRWTQGRSRARSARQGRARSPSRRS
jgi:hypothetical protein